MRNFPAIQALKISLHIFLACSAILSVVSLGLTAQVQSIAPSAIAGDWSGTLNTGASTLPVILHLRDDARGGWIATADSPSQKAAGIAGTNAKLDSAKFTVEFPSIKGTFAGTLSADGKTLDGTWTQNKTWPLVLKQTNTAAEAAQASVAPSGSAAPGVSLASITEPAAINVVYYVDPAGNQVPLEYDVPFRAGFTSILETRREQSIIRFPQGSSFRFVVRIPAGKSADFMQVDPDRGWRTIPIGWAGKSKGAVMSGGKAARMVPFDTATVGTSATLITPRDPLVPGEYCINLHSEEWFCFGVDPGGAADAPASAASSGGGSTMTNADIIKLASAGLSGDIIANTIRQAPSHNFDLSIDGLIALKKAGVPDAAVAAMQLSNSATTAAGTPSGPPHVPDSKIPAPPDLSAFYAVDARGRLVRLEAGKADLIDARNTVTEGGQVYYKLFGTRSPVRFTDGSVSIVIKLPPKGHGFLASMDNDNQFGDLYDMQIRRWEPTSGVREARFSTRKQHPGRDFTPDPGTFEFATIKIGESFYKVVPIEPLVPGEYCVGLHSLPTEYERLYCFGIDPAR